MVKLSKRETEGVRLQKHSQWGDVIKRLSRDKLAMVGLAIVLLLILLAVFADVIAPYDYKEQDLANRLAWPSAQHLLGTDNFGRDLLSRIIYGARTSLLVALLSLIISTVIGIVLGAFAGYFGGWTETVIMRVMDIIMAIPQILLAVSIQAALGTGVFNTALAISISGIPMGVRIIRAQIMSIRDEEYVEAAIATGSGSIRVLFRQILPNCLAPLIVDMSLRVGMAIMAISGLSFIGLGVQPPTAEWGSIMTAGRTYIRDFWPLATFPGVAIFLALFGFNVLGDGLRDAMDPKLKN